MPEGHSKRTTDGVAAGASEPNKGPASADGELVERRANVRYPFTAAAEVVEMRSKATVTGRSADLGLGGCYVDTISPFPAGTRVKLCLTLESRTFESHAAVIYAHVGMGMGLAFTEIRPDQLMVLEDWLRELSGNVTPASDLGQAPSAGPSRELSERLVLSQLITLLIRKRILTESEGGALLRELFG